MKSNIDQDQILLILESLKTCINLKSLNLSENTLNLSLKPLIETLKHLKSIAVLALNNCQIGSKGFNSLLLALSEIPDLEELHLASNDFDDSNIQHLKTKYKYKFFGLKALNLSNNKITKDGAEFLKMFIEDKSQLRYLRLGNNNLGDEGIRWITEGLKNGSQNDFDISKKGFSEKGSKCLESFLRKSPYISYLNLERNNISLDRMNNIINIVKENKCPCTILVSGNQFEEVNAQNLASTEIFKKKIYFKEIKLIFNQ